MPLLRGLLKLGLSGLLVVMCPSASAAKFCFGEGERIVHMVGTPMVSPDGVRLWLARKLTTSCFLFPYNQRDDGYVLAPGGKTDRYFPFPDAEEVARLQSAGSLPSPLPSWEPGFWHLVFDAYLLWFFLLALGLALLWARLKRRLRS